jgi:PAS domain S-box-containing protein
MTSFHAVRYVDKACRVINPAAIRDRPLFGLALAICAAHVLESVVLGESDLGSLLSNVLQALAAVVATLLSIGAARRSTGLGLRFWSLVAIAFAVWALGQATYTYHENWIGQAVPQPSWTHLLFRLYGAPLLMALLIGQGDDESPGLDGQRVLDFAQVGILSLFFYFDLYFPAGDLRASGRITLWGFFGLADAENWAILVAFVARARLSGRPDEKALVSWFVPYLACYAAGSTFSNFMFSIRDLKSGGPVDTVFTISLTVAAFLGAHWKPQPDRLPAAELASDRVTWVPVILPLVVLALALPMARREPVVAFVAVFGSVACFGARLLLTLYRRRRIMEALHASESRYADLLRLAPDAIFVSTDGRISYANPATAKLLGLETEDDVIGKELTEFALPDWQEEQGALPKDAQDEGDATSLVVRRKDGARIHLEAVAMTMQGSQVSGSVPSRLVIARDVTERHHAEAERETLVQALEAKNAELERFTYTVSHDLRSPLVTIGTYISHVEDAAEKGHVAGLRDDVERIRRASGKMDLLLKDLLELSRIGHVIGPAEPVPFEILVREAAAAVRGKPFGQGLELQIETGLPVVRGDRARLVEMIQNLLDNAARFMGGQKSPRVEAGARMDGDETVLFIRDNGLGIEPQHQVRVFGLFNRLDPKGEGTGVGLALVKRIVELHAGRIWVESDGRAKGSTFCFTLPIVTVDDGPEGAP